MEFRQIGVLGAGNIGVGVVTDLVLHGITAVIVDISQEILRRAQAEVLKTKEKLARHGRWFFIIMLN